MINRPITPDEAAQAKLSSLPKEIIPIFNQHIADAYSGKRAKVMQDDVMGDICSTLGVDRETVYKNHWLDVECIYREAGWKVEYHSPDYTESFPSYFIFEKP